LDADSGNHLLFADAMGMAYHKAGDLENALREHEKIISPGTRRLDYGDIYAKSYYWLGKISEQEGKKVEAAGNYRKFLSLWKDADPGLPEVPDAKARLAAISN